eukprot:scaffold4839_cov39-Tisochrysis_lutea.AAC.1
MSWWKRRPSNGMDCNKWDEGDEEVAGSARRELGRHGVTGIFFCAGIGLGATTKSKAILRRKRRPRWKGCGERDLEGHHCARGSRQQVALLLL